MARKITMTTNQMHDLWTAIGWHGDAIRALNNDKLEPGESHARYEQYMRYRDEALKRAGLPVYDALNPQLKAT